MSPRTKSVTVSVSAIGTILVIGGALWTGGSRAITVADTRYVRLEAFRAHRVDEQVQHLRDSTSLRADLVRITSIVAGLDSSDRCRRGQREYCR